MRYFVTVGNQELEVVVDGDHVTVGGRPVAARLERHGDAEVILQLDGARHHLGVAGRDDEGWQLVDGGAVRAVLAIDERTRHIQSLAGAGRSAAGGGTVKAPMPGLVVRVLVAVGEAVRAGQSLVVLEAMKMENELKAPAAGIVTSIAATVGAAVDKGAVLVVLEGAAT